MTKPEIRVTYDRNQPERDGLYREPRTATVTVKERNFDPGDVEFFITNTEGSLPEISGWSHSGSGEESLHSCKVAFQEDGTYTFRVAVMDLAGNQGGVRRNGHLYHRSDAAGASGILGGAGGQERQLLPGGAQGANSGAGAELRSGTCPN